MNVKTNQLKNIVKGVIRECIAQRIVESTPQLNDKGEYETYAWPGGYPIFYVTKDNGVLCPKCANDNKELTMDKSDPQWNIVAADVNWENHNMKCDHCNKPIEAAYDMPAEKISGDINDQGDVDETAAPGQEKWIKANKSRFKKEYGSKKGLNVLYGKAWNKSKGIDEASEQDENSDSNPDDSSDKKDVKNDSKPEMGIANTSHPEPIKYDEREEKRLIKIMKVIIMKLERMHVNMKSGYDESEEVKALTALEKIVSFLINQHSKTSVSTVKENHKVQARSYKTVDDVDNDPENVRDPEVPQS